MRSLGKYPIDVNCKPTAKYGMLGLFRATTRSRRKFQAIVVGSPKPEGGRRAIGIGEITSILRLRHC